MKKVAAIPAILLYLLSVSGVAVNAHYCCGKLASVRVVLESAPSPMSSTQTKNNCCDNIIHFYKVNAAQQASTQTFSFEAPILQIPVLTAAIDFMMPPVTGTSSLLTSAFHSPPLQTALPLFIRNESFLI